MRTVIVGTTPVLLSSINPQRVRWALEFIPSSVVAGNTGKVFVGRGFIPVASTGDTNAGDILNAGASIEEKKGYADDKQVFKGNIWAISDTTAQQLTYDEQVSDNA